MVVQLSALGDRKISKRSLKKLSKWQSVITHFDTSQYAVQAAGMPVCSGCGPTPFEGYEVVEIVPVLVCGVPGTVSPEIALEYCFSSSYVHRIVVIRNGA